MNHSVAQTLFEEIRNRPYAWSTSFGKSANNCYFKGIELLQRLGILGYSVRGRVGDTYLDDSVPIAIKNLYPAQFPLTHFWVEIQIDNSWRILDASYDPPLAKAGFVVNEWNSNRTCFDITKIYTQEEAIAYQVEWANPEYGLSYFEAVAPCANAMNQWLETMRSRSAS
jgi:hypothetical protein